MLADRAGLSVHVIRKIEQNPEGSALLSTLKALASALSVPVGSLLSEPEPAVLPSGQPRETGPERPTLLRYLIRQRHWQTYKTFEIQFSNAAQDVARRDREPALAKLIVSRRQWQRWYHANVTTEPYPDACRVLEYMFGYPIQKLLAHAEPGEEWIVNRHERFPEESLRRNTGQEPTTLVPSGGARTVEVTDTPQVSGANELASFFGLAGEDGNSMKRRAFIVGLTALGSLSANEAGMALEPMRHNVNHAFAEGHAAADVDEWHEIVQEYGHTYPITAPADLLRTLVVDLYGLQAAMGWYPQDENQRQLRRAGAMLCAFMAQSIANLGHLREAQRWWRTARRVADESGDLYTMLWVRGREIVRAGYEHRPVVSILQLVDEGEKWVDANVPVAALPEFLGGKAQTLALMAEPDRTQIEETLLRLRNALDALPFQLRAASDSIFTWGEERLCFTESLVYTYLGDFKKASVAQDRALKLYPAGDLRSPAQIELQRALCLVNAGEVTPGIQHAQSIVASLPAMHRVRPVADLGHKVLRAVPLAEQRRAGGPEYRDCLCASFTVRTPALTA